MVLAIGNDNQFEKFSILVERNWYRDDRYKTNACRVVNRKFLVPEIESIIKEKSSSEWMTLLEKNGVPCGPVNTLADILNDPHVKYRGIVEEIKTSDGEIIPIIANPIRYSKTPMVYSKPPPKLKR
jgi:crotonobetainyl-CoA:carnitine CoA-transferase CaiB-like acyl-CoA transferase